VQFSQLPSRPIEMDGPSTGQQTATATISNSGNVTENGTVNLNFYLSADSVLDNSDPLLATFANKPISLKPGGHQAVSFKIAVPPGTAVGSYFLFAVMTPGSSLHDSNADNNVAMSSQRVAVVSTLPRPARIINQTNSVDVIVNVDETDTVICTDTGNCDGSSNSDGSSDGTNGSSDDSSDQSDSGQSDTAPSGSQDAPGSDSSGDDSSSDDSDSGSMDDGG